MNWLPEEFLKFFISPSVRFYKKYWLELGLASETDTRPSFMALINESVAKKANGIIRFHDIRSWPFVCRVGPNFNDRFLLRCAISQCPRYLNDEFECHWRAREAAFHRCVKLAAVWFWGECVELGSDWARCTRLLLDVIPAFGLLVLYFTQE